MFECGCFQIWIGAALPGLARVYTLEYLLNLVAVFTRVARGIHSVYTHHGIPVSLKSLGRIAIGNIFESSKSGGIDLHGFPGYCSVHLGTKFRLECVCTHVYTRVHTAVSYSRGT